MDGTVHAHSDVLAYGKSMVQISMRPAPPGVPALMTEKPRHGDRGHREAVPQDSPPLYLVPVVPNPCFRCLGNTERLHAFALSVQFARRGGVRQLLGLAGVSGTAVRQGGIQWSTANATGVRVPSVMQQQGRGCSYGACPSEARL